MDKLSAPLLPAVKAPTALTWSGPWRRLPEHLRLPLVMYYMEHRGVSDIALELRMSASNVYERLRTALQELHGLLIEQGDAP